MKLLVLTILLLCVHNIVVGVSQKINKKLSITQNTGKFQSSGTFEMKAPDLNDEEFHSSHMPDHLKCDSCRAISYQMQEYLSKRESQISAVKEGKAMLTESEYTDALEKCCAQSWERHGVIDVDSVKRLSGPGLETEDFTGVKMLSGPWPGRLFKMCQAYLGEFTEDDIYNEYRNNRDYLEDFICYGENGACTKHTTGFKDEM
ncbi:marginal zone B- and B1-cell-specific protein isoform X1 [Amblyraja radiata]|uniref:marginal zone B- and B1-cell-specific protein isoform X1 n=2 Tax=Amblyraja radiata TaxID=386614 RepID=UPI001402F067|nr:marginal zone B- and B1-cell-specific protein isoform X1 [Amblyraja radiata]XP_032905576.1 marginal zone B- and B1-cell-specific protein isoform X1 [Amblyraja radiata]XP_032905577.1 marginal zone B- and B1-cell-specific protein isoform X1 [Amblyraja radiata]